MQKDAKTAESRLLSACRYQDAWWLIVNAISPGWEVISVTVSIANYLSVLLSTSVVVILSSGICLRYAAPAAVHSTVGRRLVARTDSWLALPHSGSGHLRTTHKGSKDFKGRRMRRLDH
jgi:hypothetical protein